MPTKKIILHPFLFALYPIIFTFTHNINELPVSILNILTLSAAAILLTFLFELAPNAISKKYPHKNAATLSFVIFFFFSFGHIQNALSTWLHLSLRLRYMLPAYFLFIVAGVVIILRLKKDFTKTTKILNMISLALLAVSLINLIPLGKNAPSLSWDPAHEMKKQNLTPAKPTQPSELPNIYYIVLDAYPGQHTLKKFFNYDNSDFETFLKDKGFYVVQNSLSNYPVTHMSLGSTLNLQYLPDYLKKDIKKGSPDFFFPYLMTQKNIVSTFLKKMGYKFYYIDSGMSAFTQKSAADSVFCEDPYQILSFILQNSMLRPFTPFLIDPRNTVICAFKELNQIAQTSTSPTFTFAHIMLPHLPLVFKKDGGFVYYKEKEQNFKNKKGFIDQLQYANHQTKLLINNILAQKSANPPVIILQSDHGATIKATNPNRLNNFSAIYLPHHSQALYSTITPVNVFRVVLNSYFETSLPLLNDKSYLFPDENELDLFEIDRKEIF